MTETQKLWFSRHEDDERFDEVTLKVVPRYKTSGLSGDEWRVSVVAQLKRKGVVIAERSWGKMEWALLGLGGFSNEASDKPMGATWEETAGAPEEAFCFQPGCAERSVAVYALKHRYCREGHKSEAMSGDRRYARAFCLRHLRRGDCGLEDADANYDVLSGPSSAEAMPHPDDESPSSVVTVTLDSIEDLPDAIEEVRKSLPPAADPEQK